MIPKWINARRWKHQWGGLIASSLVYKPFVPEDIKKEVKESPKQDTEVSEITIDQTRFPVEPVRIQPIQRIEFQPNPEKYMQNEIEETISGVNANLNNLNEINKQLKDAGYKKTQRAAILATIVAESGANPAAIGDAGKARGLFQWHPNRFTAGIDLGSQIRLILSELKDFDNRNAWSNSRKYNKRNAYDIFHSTDDLNAAISALTANYIRPANADKEIQKRYNIAQQLINQMA